jgi:hypothetical protein
MVKRGKQTVPTASLAQQAKEGSASVTHAADHGPISSTTEEEIREQKLAKPDTK